MSLRFLAPLLLLPAFLSPGCAAPTPPPGTSSVPAQPPAATSAPAWVTRAVPAPRVTHHVFASAATKGNVSYHLYRPAAYADDGRPLHGRSGKLTRLEELLESVFAAGERVLIFTHFAQYSTISSDFNFLPSDLWKVYVFVLAS